MKNKSRIDRNDFTAGIKASDCAVVLGGLKANVIHFEKLLADNGMKPADIEELCRSHQGMRIAVLRAELHRRGILPIAGRGSAAANANDDVPAQLEREIASLATAIETLGARISPSEAALRALPGVALPARAALPASAPTIESLRAEIKTLQSSLDPEAIQRKMECLNTVHQIEAGTYDAQKPGMIAKLRAELASLAGTIESAAASRKYEICRQLKQLEECDAVAA